MGKKIIILLIGIIIFTTINLSEGTSGDEIIYGRIYGITYQLIGWGEYSIPLVSVRTENIRNLSNLTGHYELKGLVLNKVYEVTAKKIGFKDTIISVELTDSEPEKNINIELLLRDSLQKSTNGHNN